jgi:hypothetical protein
MIQTIKTVCNKEMGYLAAAKKYNLPRCTLYDYVRSKLGRKPIILPALEEKIVEYLLVIERKYFGCARDDVIRLAVQLAVHNKIRSPFSIAKEAADKDRFKRCMKTAQR